MSEKINWTLNVQVIGGPKLSASNTMTVDAYDKIQVAIEAGETDKKVEVQPGGAGHVQFLLILSDPYDELLTYKVNDSGGTAVKLDGPHLLIGKGAVALLSSAPSSFFFSNGLSKNASVEILIGREAT